MVFNEVKDVVRVDMKEDILAMDVMEDVVLVALVLGMAK